MTRILTIANLVWTGIIRKKDVYVLLVLMGSFLAALVSLDLFGLRGVVGYVLDMGLLMAWLFSWILAVNVSARELPQEEMRGTIFPLLAKPVTRAELLLGKWLGAWSAVTAATLLFYALVLAIVLARGGYVQPVAILQGFVLHSAVIGIVSAMAFAFSTRMNPDAAASLTFVLSAASFLVVPRIPNFMALESGIRSNTLLFLYNILPHFEVFDMRRRMTFEFGPAAWGTFFIVLAYGFFLSAMFLTIAWMAYRHKRFSRGTLTSV